MRAARWTLGPARWRGSASASERVLELMRRARFLVGRPGGRSPQRADGPNRPVGYLHRSASDNRVVLLEAIHPVTGDQLLTTDEDESLQLGYGTARPLGALEPFAAVTGQLGPQPARIPWASRFGQRPA